MNFVGHAAVASWEDDDPRFGLGAMLPDLARMIGAPAGTQGVRARDEAVRRGVRHHHRVDAVFHDAPTFVALSTRLRQRLTRAAVRRGPTLAAAHVGIELLLDGELLRRDWVRTQWARTAALAARPGDVLAFGSAPVADRYAAVCARLSDITAGYVDADAVAGRLVRVLGRRPRLAANARDVEGIVAGLREVAPAVATATDDLLDELSRRLKERP